MDFYELRVPGIRPWISLGFTAEERAILLGAPVLQLPQWVAIFFFPKTGKICADGFLASASTITLLGLQIGLFV